MLVIVRWKSCLLSQIFPTNWENAGLKSYKDDVLPTIKNPRTIQKKRSNQKLQSRLPTFDFLGSNFTIVPGLFGPLWRTDFRKWYIYSVFYWFCAILFFYQCFYFERKYIRHDAVNGFWLMQNIEVPDRSLGWWRGSINTKLQCYYCPFTIFIILMRFWGRLF